MHKTFAKSSIPMDRNGRAQAVNPYLPSWEYIPDGEPYVFGDRVYVYGSHDIVRGETFCLGDYVCWSAPVNDPGSWRYEGIISMLRTSLWGATTDITSTTCLTK